MKIQERKERDRLRKQQDFFAAAEKLFAQKGYDNTSVSDIAHEAGYAAGTLYLYFANKDELLIGCLEYNMTLFQEALHEAIDGIDDPRERFKAYIYQEVLGLVKHSRALSVLFPILIQPKWWEQHDQDGRLHYIVSSKDQMITAILEDLGDQGFVDSSVDIGFFISAIGAMIREMVICHSIKKRLDMDPDEIAERIYQYACRMLGFKSI